MSVLVNIDVITSNAGSLVLTADRAIKRPLMPGDVFERCEAILSGSRSLVVSYLGVGTWDRPTAIAHFAKVVTLLCKGNIGLMRVDNDSAQPVKMI